MLRKIKKEYFRFIKRQYERHYDALYDEAPLEDVFGTGYGRAALISYIKAPFVGVRNLSHSNWLECLTAAEIFNDLGYRVDVIQLTASGKNIDYDRYKVVYGSGKPLSLAFGRPGVKTILYAPGCSTRFSNPATLKALYRFYQTSGLLAWDSARLCPDTGEQPYFADFIIPLGNAFVANTYAIEGIRQTVKPLPAFYFDVYDIDLDAKDFSACRRNFLWFGSAGFVHKGLDIVLEVFKRRPDLNLFICGVSERESVFFNYYQKELSNKVVNIKNMGFVWLDSSAFKMLMDTCPAVLYPSASEGGAAAIVNVMANGGLIPAVSRQTGLDADGYGFIMDELSETVVEAGLDAVGQMDEPAMRSLWHRIKTQTRETYAYEHYKTTLAGLIGSVVKTVR